jgi:3-methyladenine DNA glycosylase AlkC
MAEALKNQYDRAYLQRLASVVSVCAPAGINEATLVEDVFRDGWEELELKGRMRRICTCLRTALPPEYLEALPIVRAAAANFDGYMSMFFPDFVEQYGLDYWEESIAALHWMTRFGSSEFAVRPFLKADAPRFLKVMLEWTHDENEHVRRLASEGCRPLLPWAMNLPDFQRDPKPLLPILEALRSDTSEYVRRSVANNLNDISKDHPSLVLEIATAWKGKSKDGDRLVKHACRTLLKSGDVGAMQLFGFRDAQHIVMVDFQLTEDSIPLGGTLNFAWSLYSNTPLGKIRMEYRIDFARPHGRGARKIFQISESESNENSRAGQRKHSFADRSTRKHYVGEHQLTLLVNGVAKAAAKFWLV